MSREKEVNILVDAKNKSKGAFLEVSKDLKNIGNSAKEGMSGLASSLDKGTSNIKKFTDKLGFMDKAVKKTFKGAAAMGGVYVASTLRDFSKLNSGIANVNTLYDQTAQSQKKMYDDSIKMLKMLPTDFDNITGATYDAISAGADPKHATMFARKFGMGAVAGNADMPVVTKAAMGTMNAYKLEAKDLNNILDLQFMTVKKGITTYDELASSLGTGILASAKSSGVSLEELYGSIAMITKNAIPANVATTSLNQLFNQFTDNKAIGSFKDFGVAIQDANHKTRPLIEILKDLNLQFEKKNFTSEQRKGFLKEILGSDEASRAIMPLISDMKDFQDILGSMDKSDGAMKDAFGDQLESVSVQAKLMWNNIKGHGVEVVHSMSPLWDAILKPFTEKQKLQLDLAELQDNLAMTEGYEIKLKISDLEQQIKEEFDRELSEGFKIGVNPEIKNEKIVKFKNEIAILEKQLKNLDQTEDGKTRKELEKQILEIETKIEEIDLSPIEAFKDGLREGVENLEKINPPLAKFVDTVGKFALSFVGEEGEDKRDKYGNIGKGILGVYAFKKGVDALSWIFGKGKGLFDLFGGGKGDDTGKGIGDSLATTMKTMNVQAGVVNVYGGKGGMPGGGNVPLGLPGGAVLSKTLSTLGSYALPVALASLAATAIGAVVYTTINDIRNPELVEHLTREGEKRYGDLDTRKQRYIEEDKPKVLSKEEQPHAVYLGHTVKYREESKENKQSQENSKNIKLMNDNLLSFSGAMKDLINKTPKQDSSSSIKTSKDIETVKDSSHLIKGIESSMMSFSSTVKELAKSSQPIDSVKKQPSSESFLMKEINRVTEVDNKISLQNAINVAAPPVSVSVSIDGKNIPSNTSVNSSTLVRGFMKEMEILSRRTGK